MKSTIRICLSYISHVNIFFDSSALDEFVKYSEYIIFMFSKVYYSNPNVFFRGMEARKLYEKDGG